MTRIWINLVCPDARIWVNFVDIIMHQCASSVVIYINKNFLKIFHLSYKVSFDQKSRWKYFIKKFTNFNLDIKACF